MAQVRVDEKTHQRLCELSREMDVSLGDVVAKAVERYRRERILLQAVEAQERLREDPVAWAEYRAELALWDNTLMDGLEDEEW
jgi:hypothetical protein